MIIRTARLTARVCVTLIGILLIVLALLSAGVRLGLPLVANYKPTIESRLSDYLRSPVAIGDLNLSWEGFGPLLRAEQVAVFESSESKVTLDELLIDLNLAKSLMRGVPVINELTLVGARLAVEADANGRFRLHGMDKVQSARGAAADPEVSKGKGVDLMAWLLIARKVGLLDTEVTLIDEQSDLRLVMQDLNIRAENVGDVHQLRVDVQLPEELGGSLEAGIDLVGSSDAWSSASGDLYIKADTLQTQALSKILKVGGLSDKLRRVKSPVDTAVSLELWGRWEEGQLVSARGPVSTSQIKHPTTGDYLGDGLSANLVLTGLDQTFKVIASDVILSMGTNTVRIDSIYGNWNDGLSASGTAAQKPRSWVLSAAGAQLDLGASSQFVGGALAGSQSTVAKVLLEAKPAGDFLNWTVNYTQQEGIPSLSIQGDIHKLQASSSGLMPGFGPLNGRVNLENFKGELALASGAMELPWPAVTDAALTLDSLNAVIGIDIAQKNRVLIEGDIELIDGGIDLSTRLNLTLAKGQSPHLDMQSRFAATDITALKQWLPRKKLSKGFGLWVDRAIESGSLDDGSILFFGNVVDFPFAAGEGVFRASADMRDARIAFHPAWPSAFDVNGNIEVNGPTLTASAENSSLEKFDISQIKLDIKNLKRPVLTLSGTGSGELQDVLEFGVNGPLKAVLGPVLADVSGNGATQMDLALALPLYRSKPVSGEDVDSTNTAKVDQPRPSMSVDGSLFLNGNTVEFEQANMPLQGVSGSIGFNRHGIRVNSLKAEFLNQPIRINAKTVGQSNAAVTTLSVNGALEGNDVLAHYGNPLDQFIRGASNWSAELVVPHSEKRFSQEGVRLKLVSDLVGSELVLPKPLYKNTATSRRVVVETAFRKAQNSQQWDVRLDGKLHASATASDDGLESLVMKLGGSSLSPLEIARAVPGIRLTGRVDRMAADDWVTSIARLIDSTSDDDVEEQTPIIPVSAQLDIDSLELGRDSLGSASLSMSSDDRFLTATIKNASIDGWVEYPRNHWSKELPLKARIEHIDMAVIDALTSEEDDSSSASRGDPIDPRTLPPIDARIARFTRESQTVKEIVLRAQPDVSGLQVTTLGFAYQTMQLVGQGFWRLRDPQGVNPDFTGQHLTQLDLVLQSDDFGLGFEHIGLNDVISKGEGSAEVQLAWPNAAYLPSLDTLDGSIKLNIERGSIIPLEPGAGKMVGLFALQALPQRLDFDFTDISSDGLAFNRITGDADIDNGVVDVKLVQLTGPIGVVDVSGETDLNTQDFDQKITVLPRVSAALPVIGIIAGGASAGVGALIATGLLKALGVDLDRIGLREYELKGTWDEPVFSPANSSRQGKR